MDKKLGNQNGCRIVGYRNNDTRWDCRESWNRSHEYVLKWCNTYLLEKPALFTIMASSNIPSFGLGLLVTIDWFRLNIHVYLPGNSELQMWHTMSGNYRELSYIISDLQSMSIFSWDTWNRWKYNFGIFGIKRKVGKITW